ncbi:MFS transporter [Pseudohyphozyma bogoriensis]|nr:MFS transporter [Pseudohyphozyma bogoriensis]
MVHSGKTDASADRPFSPSRLSSRSTSPTPPFIAFSTSPDTPLPPNTGDSPSGWLETSAPNVLVDRALGLHSRPGHSRRESLMSVLSGNSTPSTSSHKRVQYTTDDNGQDASERDRLLGDEDDADEEGSAEIDPEGSGWQSTRRRSSRSRSKSVYRKMPWYKRPSPLWFLPGTMLMALSMGMIISPKIEIYTQLICRSLPESQPQNPRSINAFFYSTLITPDDTLVFKPSATSIFAPTSPSDTSSDDGLGGKEWSKRCRARKDVQQSVAYLSTMLTLMMGLLSALTTGYWGALSDRIGRRPILALSLLGTLLMDSIFLLAVNYHSTLGYRFLLLGPMFDGLLGGLSTAQATTNAYVSDCTDPGSRARIFSVVSGILFAGIALGPTVGSLLLQIPNASILAPFYLALCLHSFYLVVVLLILPESLSKERREKARLRHEAEEEARAAAIQQQSRWTVPKVMRTVGLGWVMSIGAFLRPLALLLPKSRKEELAEEDTPILWSKQVGEKEARGRRWALTKIAAGFSFYSLTVALTAFKIQYTIFKFSWGPVETGFFLSFAGGTRMAVLVGVLPIVIRLFKRAPPVPETERPPAVADDEPDTQETEEKRKKVEEWDKEAKYLTVKHDAHFDLFLARLSVAIDLVGYVCMALPGGNPTTFLLWTAVQSLGGGAGPALQSLALAHASPRDAGRLFASLSVLMATCSQVIGPVVFGAVFSRSVGFFPEAIYLCASLSFLISLTSLLLVRLGNKGTAKAPSASSSRPAAPTPATTAQPTPPSRPPAAAPPPAGAAGPSTFDPDNPFPYLNYKNERRKKERLALQTELGITHDEIVKRENQWRNSVISKKNEEAKREAKGKQKAVEAPARALSSSTTTSGPSTSSAPAVHVKKSTGSSLPSRPQSDKPPSSSRPRLDDSNPFSYILLDYSQRKAARLALRTKLGLSHKEVLDQEQAYRDSNAGNYAVAMAKFDPSKGKAFRELPVDVFFEICSHLDPPSLLSLTACNRQIRAVLISPIANPIWLQAREESCLPAPSDIPEWQHKGHERFTAALFCGNTCMVCDRKKLSSYEYVVSPFERVGTCRACKSANFVSKHSGLAMDPQYHPKAWKLVSADSWEWTLSQGRANSYGSFYYKPALLTISTRLRELESAHDIIVASRSGPVPHEPTEYEDYIQERSELATKKREVALKMVNLIQTKKEAWAQALRDAEAAKRAKRRATIEERLRAKGFSDIDFNSHSWKSHRLVASASPIVEGKDPRSGWLALEPVLEKFLNDAVAARVLEAARRREAERMAAARDLWSALWEELTPRAQKEYVNLSDFCKLDSVAGIAVDNDPVVVAAQFESLKDVIRREALKKTREIKMETYRHIVNARKAIALAAGEEWEDEDEPDLDEPFPERYRIDMDADFSKYSNRLFRTCCSEEEHFPAVQTNAGHYCLYTYSYSYWHTTTLAYVPSAQRVDPKNAASIRMLLKLANIKDQRTTPTLLDKITKRFSCLTCEEATRGLKTSFDVDFYGMLKHVLSHLNDKEENPEEGRWTLPKVVFKGQKRSAERRDAYVAVNRLRSFSSE